MTELANAKKIEFKVCHVEGQIDESDLQGLRQVLEATKPE